MNGVVGGCFPDEMAPDEMAPDEMAPDEMAPDEMAPDEMALHDGMDGIARSLQAGAVILRWLY